MNIRFLVLLHGTEFSLMLLEYSSKEFILLLPVLFPQTPALVTKNYTMLHHAVMIFEAEKKRIKSVVKA